MGRPPANYTKREQTEGRNFQAIAYSDVNESGEYIDERRLSSFWEKYYIIKHDSDVWHDEDVDIWCVDHPGQDFPYHVGDLKKPHYHMIGCLSTPCLLGRAAKKFGLPSNQVQRVSKLRDAKRYLVHKDHPSKYQYHPSLVITNDENYLDCLKDELDMTSKANLISGFINNEGSRYISLSRLVEFSLANGCWDELRRGQHIFHALLREHNKKADYLQLLEKYRLEYFSKFDLQQLPPYVQEGFECFQDFVQEVLEYY